jgi:hypothetical protein
MRSPCCLCVCVSVCLCVPLINFGTVEPVFMKLGMSIMALEPITTAYFINLSHQSVSVCISSIIARQRLGKNVTAETNTNARI